MPQIQVFLPEDNQLTHDLTEDKITIGRLADNSFQIDDASVSSHHAELILQDGKYLLRDLDSTNGTFVNDQKLGETFLRAGDEIRFGRIPGFYKGDEKSSASAPLPDTATLPTAEIALQSARPVGFINSSPIPRKKKGKDVGKIVVAITTCVAILAWSTAIYFVMTLSV